MKRISLLIAAGLTFFSIFLLLTFIQLPGQSSIHVTKRKEPEKRTLFQYQCIDTMKVSRDKARLLPRDFNEKTIIANEVQTIASLGANCIALGTPYDEEFLPFLGQWVYEARKAGLSVWFRGNFSSWEGWFDYQQSDSIDEHISKSAAFIRTHPTLFMDGDKFSPIVEPENGGPFDPLNTQEKNAVMRDFLVREQTAVKQAFKDIHKDVTTSWISMSGGAARSVLDNSTIAALDNTVTLDHYVKDTSVMTEYLDDFHDRYNARLVLGEFGAPIPDLNGSMNDKEQASFVDALLKVIAMRKTYITGINYWTLSESSTALTDEGYAPKPVIDVIKKYYLPGTVHVQVKDRSGAAVQNITIYLDGQDTGTSTDSHGQAVLVIPVGHHLLKLKHPDGTILITDVTLHHQEAVDVSAKFVPEIRFFLPLFNIVRTLHGSVEILL
jgi:hypothetical protein